MDATQNSSGWDGSGANTGELDSRPFTFEDIEEQMMVLYRGRIGYIETKGDIGKATERAGIKIKIMDSDAENGKVRRIYRGTVNRFLRERRTLWVNWDAHFPVWNMLTEEDMEQ